MELRFIQPDDGQLYAKERALRYEVLRRPLGMPPGSEIFPFEAESLHLVAIEGDSVIGCVLFRPQRRTGRLFAMAVAEEKRGRGVGAALVARLEAHLCDQGFQEVFLHARDDALGFYERLGYRLDGEPFEEVGLKHRRMKKDLRQLPIALASKPLFDLLFAANPPEISEHTFTNLFAWRTSRQILAIALPAGVVIAEQRGEALALVGPPLGRISLPDAVAAAEEIAGKPVASVERLPESALRNGVLTGWEVREDRANFDYVYRREALTTLAGRDLHGKRNLITQCLHEHDCRYEPITAINLPEVRSMMEQWCAARKCGHDTGLCQEFRAVKEVLTHYERLNLIGGTVRVDGEIQAFAVGERLNPEVAVIHFEKAMPEVKGLYQVVNQWFCREALGAFPFINREQDLGIEGLRKAKQSYLPDRFVKKSIAFPRGERFAAEKAQAIPETRCTEE